MGACLNFSKELLDSYDRVALAVSGGADSIAMLYNCSKLPKEIIVLTVNHNLRKEAQDECEYVLECASKLGLKGVLLEWKHGGISSNVHDKARTARYNLMTSWCLDNNISALCTAHHMDDRVENFFVRVSRGAGILGLIDKPKIKYNGIDIMRPLFGCRKSELVNYLKEHDIKWFEDKSNSDERYVRSNIRNWLKELPLDNDLFFSRVIYVKNNLERASKVIERIFVEEIEKVVFNDDGTALLNALPKDEEIAYMTLSHIISVIGGDVKPARLESIELLYSKLKAEGKVKTTLGGCIIKTNKHGILFSKEPPREQG